MFIFIINEKLSEMLLIILDLLDRIVLKMLCSCNLSEHDNEATLSSDIIDCVQPVEKLAALVGDRKHTDFLNYTCIEKDQFGKTSLRKWKCEKVKEVTLHSLFKEVNYKDLYNTTGVQIVRTAMNVAEMYMKYIKTSEEVPLGESKKLWWRSEYQDTKGNVPHTHYLLWNRKSNTLFSEEMLLQ